MERNNYHKKAILAIILFILFAGFCTLAFAANPLSNGVLDNLDPNDLLLIKRNGIVSAICYMTDLLTGPVSKVIMCLFFVAFGFMLIYGGKFNYVRVIVVTVVVAIMYGGKSVVDIVSGNKYSCQSLKYVAENEDGVAENIGYCYVNNIEEYRTSQTWKKCKDSSGNDCTISINANVDIGENDVVSLTSCGSDFYPTSSAYPKYKCVKLEDGSYKFENISGTVSICKKYCSQSALITFLSYNKKYTLLDEDGKAISRDNTPVVLSGEPVSGYGWAQGAGLKIGCTENVGNLDISAMELVCNNKGEFEIQNGTCATTCKISELANNGNVEKWDLYTGPAQFPVAEENTINKSNIEIPANELKSMDKGEVDSGQFIRVNTCAPGFSIQHSSKKAMFKCEDGQWRRANVTDGEQNTFCSLKCKKNEIKNYELISTISLVGNNNTLTTTTQEYFFPGDEIIISSCNKGASNNKDGTNRKRYNTQPARLSCSSDGTWNNDNNGEYCEKYCSLGKDSPEYNHIQFWKLYDSEGKEYEGQISNILLSSTTEIIYEGEYVDATAMTESSSACATGFMQKPKTSLPKYRCTGGKLVPENRIEDPNICVQTCDKPTIGIISALDNRYKNTLGFSYCGTSKQQCGSMISSNNPKYNKTAEGESAIVWYEDKFYTGDYIIAESCSSNQVVQYIKDSSKPSFFKCEVDESGQKGKWVIDEGNSFCIPRCPLDDIGFGISSMSLNDWIYHNAKDNSYTQLTETAVVGENDEISCKDGNNNCKNGDGNPIIYKCKNKNNLGYGVWEQQQ